MILMSIFHVFSIANWSHVSKKTFGDCWIGINTGCLHFLMANQQCWGIGRQSDKH